MRTQKYNSNSSKTLYEHHDSKRKLCKLIGWLLLGVLVGISALASAIDVSKIEFLRQSLPYVAGVLFFTSIGFFIASKSNKTAMEDVCPRCHNAYGEKISESVRSQSGYIEATVNRTTGDATARTVTTSKTYNSTYSCPHCHYQWTTIETNDAE